MDAEKNVGDDRVVLRLQPAVACTADTIDNLLGNYRSYPFALQICLYNVYTTYIAKCVMVDKFISRFAVHIISRIHAPTSSEGVVDNRYMVKTGNLIGFKVELSKYLVYSVVTWYYYMMPKKKPPITQCDSTRHAT